MGRLSNPADDLQDAEGNITDGYDYSRQCWVVNGIVAKCGHVAPIRGCYACSHHGIPIADACPRCDNCYGIACETPECGFNGGADHTACAEYHNNIRKAGKP